MAPRDALKISIDMTRRDFLAASAAAISASLAIAAPQRPYASKRRCLERRDLFPEGVASGDPAHDSVILWTRRPSGGQRDIKLVVEIAQNQAFQQVAGTPSAKA